jgi:peptidoglycan/xylan/chitin deacetylase (PgdA/CDA1 family)
MGSAPLLALPFCALALAACGGSKAQPAPPAPEAAAKLVSAPVHVKPYTGAVPILMYHVLAVPAPGVPFPGLYVAPSTFAAQVRLLAQAGYHAVTLGQVYSAWHGEARLPAHPIVLSFDDGYPPDVTVALPVLRARNWPGVLNLQVGNLIVRKVKELLAAGWEVDAHTLTHPDLTHVDSARLWQEVDGSRASIHRTYGIPVDFFCYPAGRYDATVIAAVRRAGYKAATTTQPGLARPSSDPYTLDRVRVSGGESAASLLAELRALERGGG